MRHFKTTGKAGAGVRLSRAQQRPNANRSRDTSGRSELSVLAAPETCLRQGYGKAGGRAPRARRRPLRILTAVPLCDGHDSAIMTVNLELVRHGIEVIYLGYHRSVRDVVRAAVQEDVQAIGLSSYNGGHVEFFSEVLKGLRRAGAGHVRVFGGGGGTITPADARVMKRKGVDEIFPAGTSLTAMAEWVREAYASSGVTAPWSAATCRRFETARHVAPKESGDMSPHSKSVIGITGPGGAGKTTLIDELVLRFLRARPDGRIAILTHDPGMPGKGALLGDRAAMVYAHDDRVFMHSLAAGANGSGISRETRAWLQTLRRAGFDLVLVESAGTGQQDLPFARGLVDREILVLSPEYGGALQLQKIAMLERADVVVVNKADRSRARTAIAEVGQRLSRSRTRFFATIATLYGDEGVDQLFREVGV